MNIIESTKIFSGTLRKGHKFVCAITPDGHGYESEIVVSENRSGEITASFVRTFVEHYKVSGVLGAMKIEAKHY